MGVAFTLYTISRHKDVQDKLFNEVREVFGDDKNAPVSHRQLHELKYLDAVIKETLRLYPPVQRIGRQTDVDIHLGALRGFYQQCVQMSITIGFITWCR